MSLALAFKGDGAAITSGGSRNPLVAAMLQGILSQPIEQLPLNVANDKVAQNAPRASGKDTGAGYSVA